MLPFDIHISSWIQLFALAVMFLPLLSFGICWSIPRRHARVAAAVASLVLFITTIAAALLFFNAWQTGPIIYSVNWFSVAGHELSAGIQIDDLSVLMCLVVSVVSCFVHVYSIGYMAGDPGLRKYFALLGFFTFSMMGLLLADNLLLIFVFWELVGFASYMLIGHWTERPDAAVASTKAFVINRIGDVGFLIGILLIWSNAGTLCLFPLTEETGDLSWQTIASLCLFCGAAGKSAQFPLLTWLPDAMAGPTPVSALIHAATMVAAGIFLMVRIFFLFTPDALDVIAIVGAVTALMGALSALAQFDIKKILAYSTVSQLGLMMVAIGTGAREAAVVHLFTHAFFKAGLFLAAGAVIHALHHGWHDTAVDVQDIRNMGKLKSVLPVTFFVFIICGASLAGVPFFSGFLSKEAILGHAIFWAQQGDVWKWGVAGALFVVSFLTVVYIFRLIWFVFLKEYKGQPTALQAVHEGPWVMHVPMILLSFLSVWWTISLNPFHMTGWLYYDNHASWALTFASGVEVFLALAIGYFYYKRHTATAFGGGMLFHAFYLDKIYVHLIVKPVLVLGNSVSKTDRRLVDGIIHYTAFAQVLFAHLVVCFDRIVVDGIVNGIARLVRLVGSLTRSFQGGKIQQYVFWSTIALFILLWILVF